MASFENCKLGRVTNAKALLSLLKAQDESLVINITAPWGYGKTTFLKDTQELFKENDITTIYFSAWENDYLEDPFTALFSLLKNEFETEYQQDEARIKHFAKKAIPIIGNLALRTLTHGMLNTEILERSMGDDEDIQDNISEATGKIAQNLLASYEATTKSVESFQKVLSEMALHNGGKLVIIIDELDRCRPNFAIELLERVKHIMSVDGVQFLLGTDKIQLANSIKALYGSDFDSINYLERFIDYEMYLDIKDISKIAEVEIDSLKNDDLVNEIDLSMGQGGDNIFVKQVNSMVLAFDLDIRTLKRLFRKFKLVLLLKKNDYSGYSLGLLFYLLIKKENKIEDITQSVVKLSEQYVDGTYYLLYLCSVIKLYINETEFPIHEKFTNYYTDELQSRIKDTFSDLEKHNSLLEKGLMFLAFNEREDR